MPASESSDAPPRSTSDPTAPARGTDLRRHREITDRNLLLGFFALLFVVGGGLIFLFYGGGAAALGVACIGVGAMLAGAVTLIMLGLEHLSRWLDREE